MRLWTSVPNISESSLANAVSPNSQASIAQSKDFRVKKAAHHLVQMSLGIANDGLGVCFLDLHELTMSI